MTSKRSAGLLVYRFASGQAEQRGASGTARGTGPVEVLIAHMGGPLWSRKEDAAWSIPKGLYEPGESPLEAAVREFGEEMGSAPPAGPYLELGEARQSSGKIVTTFAVEGDFDLSGFVSNLFEMEWPPRSGRVQQFPEVDRAAWFGLEQAATKLVKGQVPILTALTTALAGQ